MDTTGRVRFRMLQNAQGELVLTSPEGAPPSDYRPLDGFECMRVAASALEGPGVVVENGAGDYVVLLDGRPDVEAHIPLNLDDADVLTSRQPALARFGRRDDDELELTPWAPDQPVPMFDPDADEFADVPVVALRDGELAVLRGVLDPDVATLVAERLAEAGDPEASYGVFTNPFGESVCVAVGDPIEPHEDVRQATVIRLSRLAEGAATLGEVAAVLRAYADRLDAAEAAGWRLPQPIADDHGFPERSD